MSACLQSVDFGPLVGSISLFELPYEVFNERCKQNEGADHTGLRVYSGGHVAIRFLLKLSDLFKNKSIIELGCGVGAVGLIGSKFVSSKKVSLKYIH